LIRRVRQSDLGKCAYLGDAGGMLRIRKEGEADRFVASLPSGWACWTLEWQAVLPILRRMAKDGGT